MMENEFLEISQLQWGPVKYNFFGLFADDTKNMVASHCMSMSNHNFPISIRQTEFDYLKKLIVKHNLKNGFELATAFGVSTVALGLGFKQTGGKLITMDAYVEEHLDTHLYDEANYQKYQDTDGWKSVNYLIEHFRLKDVVKPDIGWSPDDTGNVIAKNTTKKLDFVFLDAGHFPEQVKKDLTVIKPFLDEKYLIVLHDYYPSVFPPYIVDWIIETFGYEPKVVLPNPIGDNLAILTNMVL